MGLKVGRCSPDQAESALQGSGTVTRQGDIISFVADDLHSKIKLSSPVSKSKYYVNSIFLSEILNVHHNLFKELFYRSHIEIILPAHTKVQPPKTNKRHDYNCDIFFL